MSKSLGNLVLVSQLRASGVETAAIRLGLLAGHYRSDRFWVTKCSPKRRRDCTDGEPRRRFLPARTPRTCSLDSGATWPMTSIPRRPCRGGWLGHRCAGVRGHDPSAPVTVSAAVDALLGVRI